MTYLGSILRKQRITILIALLYLIFPNAYADSEDGVRIVGGEDAHAGDWPYMAALIWTIEGTDFQWCAGSLIAPNWVLTAAHCVLPPPPTKPPNAVVIGRLALSAADGERIGINDIIVHPSYNSDPVDNDIALIRLSSPSQQLPAMPITFADMEALQPRDTMTVIGWGRLSEGGPVSNILQQVDVELISQNTCNAPDWYNGKITTNQFCAGVDQGGKDSCQGDSGGPILTELHGRTVQTGIVSWGYGCARPKLPGVYTRLANYQDWLISHIGNSFDSQDHFGHAVSRGDYDNDGHIDLAVGAPFEAPQASGDSGVVSLYKGTPNGFMFWKKLDQTGLSANEAGDHFGHALASGDFNGDGVDDLAVGTPGNASGSIRSGHVFVFNGTPGGLQPSRVLNQSSLDLDETGDRFGHALTSGDFNGDGIDDLAVGAPEETLGSTKSGYAFIFAGNSNGLSPRHVLEQTGFSGNAEGDRFGHAMIAGDFNGDGVDDLVIGAPGKTHGFQPKAGSAFVFTGAIGVLQPEQRLNQTGLGSNEAGDRFGHTFTAGDFNGDGVDDLAVGAPGEAPGSAGKSGYAFVFMGDVSGLDPWKGLSQAGIGANEAGDRFGHSLTSGDFNGDGIDDLAVGAPQKALGTTKSGYAFIFSGNSNGVSPWHGLGQAGLGGNEAGDRFGYAMIAGDFNGDGVDDLAIGAPGEAPGSASKSGYTFVFTGDTNALQPWVGLN